MFARISSLFRNLTIYGVGDVATSLASFLLLPLYVHFLTPHDYGVIGLLLTVEVVAKIVFRWGVDASFMRMFYDCESDGDRQRLASTIFLFLAGVNGAILLASLVLAPFVSAHLFGSTEPTAALRLVLVNTFVVGFYFIPFHVLRIREQSRQFIALTFARSVLTLLIRLLLVVGFGLGVLGFVLADVIVTGLFTMVLAPWFAPLIRPMLSAAVLRDALRFGLPRLPHGLAQQAIAVADRYLLTKFVTLAEIGLYSIGATFGMTMKLFLSAFEYAWAPFYFSVMKEPDAAATFRLVTTYGTAVLVLLVAGLSAIADDIVRLMTQPAFHGAAAVVPWIAVGVLFQGVYLLTSIGLNITKRTEYYPLATGVAAATSLGANLLLIPRHGALGAAWANALAYAVLAAVAFAFSQRVYPIRYERGRLARIAAAGALAYLAGALLPAPAAAAGMVPILDAERSVALLGVLSRGTVVLVVYPLALLALGFYHPRELALAGRALGRIRPGRGRLVTREEPTELGGEIVSAPLPEPVVARRDDPGGAGRGSAAKDRSSPSAR